MSKANKKAATVQPMATSKTNCRNCTACTCGKQATLAGSTPHRDGDNLLTATLEAAGGWRGRKYLAASLQKDERKLRELAEASAGRVIFSSARDGGLCATIHAQKVEALNCAAELRARGLAHFKRAAEIEQALRLKGGFACVQFLHYLAFALLVLLLALRVAGGVL